LLIIALKRKRMAYDIDLPHSWLWDISRLETENYSKTQTHPVLYFKLVAQCSREQELLDELLFKLDFGNIQIVQAYTLVSPVLAHNMGNTHQIQKSRMAKSPAQFFSSQWTKKADSDLREKTMEFFLSQIHKWSWNKDTQIKDSPVMPCVHGTGEKTAWEIATDGFASLSILDKGYYGKGIYFSTSALYVLPYFAKKKKPTIIICLAIPGNPYPVTESPNSENTLSGQPIRSGYQSHYVVVKKDGNPMTQTDYDNLEEGYDELVLEQEAQVVPIFLLALDKESVTKLVADTHTSLDAQIVPLEAAAQTESDPLTESPIIEEDTNSSFFKT